MVYIDKILIECFRYTNPSDIRFHLTSHLQEIEYLSFYKQLLNLCIQINRFDIIRIYFELFPHRMNKVSAVIPLSYTYISNTVFDDLYETTYSRITA